MAKVTIYFLGSEYIASKQDLIDGIESVKAYYVGSTKRDLKNRLSEHRSQVNKTIPKYPYHQELKKLGDKWDIFELESFDDSVTEKKHAEEYWIIRLLAEGNSILNIKRGSIIRTNSENAESVLEKLNVSSGREFAEKRKEIDRIAKSFQSLRARLFSKLERVGISENNEYFIWTADGQEYPAPRGYKKAKAVEWIMNDHPYGSMYKLKQKIESIVAIK